MQITGSPHEKSANYRSIPYNVTNCTSCSKQSRSTSFLTGSRNYRGPHFAGHGGSFCPCLGCLNIHKSCNRKYGSHKRTGTIYNHVRYHTFNIEICIADNISENISNNKQDLLDSANPLTSYNFSLNPVKKHTLV